MRSRCASLNGDSRQELVLIIFLFPLSISLPEKCHSSSGSERAERRNWEQIAQRGPKGRWLLTKRTYPSIACSTAGLAVNARIRSQPAAREKSNMQLELIKTEQITMNYVLSNTILAITHRTLWHMRASHMYDLYVGYRENVCVESRGCESSLRDFFSSALHLSRCSLCSANEAAAQPLLCSRLSSISCALLHGLESITCWTVTLQRKNAKKNIIWAPSDSK